MDPATMDAVSQTSASASQPSHHPTIINLPQPSSNPDTPEMPGTPTSTTTSISALSTIAIKDGHRGTTHHSAPGSGPGGRGHQHHPSNTSLEAERADRISRLAGLSSVNTLRAPPPGSGQHNPHYSPQITPTSTGFPANSATVAQAHAAGMAGGIGGGAGGGGGPAPPAAYFDANGQPVAGPTKMSTVGTASATDSVGGHTTTGVAGGDGDGDGDQDMLDEDMLSTDTNYRETEVDSASGYGGGMMRGDMDAMMDDDLLATRSVGGYEDRMSDDGSASLVGFGEGAGSTVSGPIYHRRPLPGQIIGGGGGGGSSAGAMQHIWGLERSASGLSEGATMGTRRDTVRATDASGLIPAAGSVTASAGGGNDTPVSASAAAERRDARMVDGVATDGGGPGGRGGPGDDPFVDTTTRGPVPIVQPGATSAIRETQQPYAHQQSPGAQHPGSTSSREAAERIVRERLDNGEAAAQNVLGSPAGDGQLGRFYFEEQK